MHSTRYVRKPFLVHSLEALGICLPPVLAAVVALVLLCSPVARAQQANEKTFATPGHAVLALYDAAKSNDSQAFDAIFGGKAKPILHTGDDVADKNMVAAFVSRYDLMHRLVAEPDQTVTLYVGLENWPLPIPIVKNSNGAWYFDTASGEKEILRRRVGTNENDAIEILYTLVDAQREFAATSPAGAKTRPFANRFLSDEGQHNGLYWKTSENEPSSPIGPLLVAAASENYNLQKGQRSPFHGYYYRILTRQGPAAKGGARDYLQNGKLEGGFAFVAYPAEYRNSGVMTFIVNQNGTVFEKDLGPQTSQIAVEMKDYDPDKTWQPTD